MESISTRSFARGLVHQIDSLVGQEAVGDVTIRKNGSAHKRSVLDSHAMVQFVTVLQAAQDGNRVRNSRLIDHHWLKTALKRGVLLNVLPVFVERGSAYAVQFTAGPACASADFPHPWSLRPCAHRVPCAIR